jgi:hypothetical protein
VITRQPAVRRRRPAQRRRQPVWPLLLLVLGLAVVGGVAAWALLGDGEEGGATPPGTQTVAAGAPVKLAGVGAHDPDGDRNEHDAEAPKATDGNVATEWDTEGYNSSFEALGKSGVGLVLDARKAVELQSVTLITDDPGFKAEIHAGDSRNGPFERVSPAKTTTATTAFPIDADAARFWVIWITDIGDGGRAEVAEVTAKAA